MKKFTLVLFVILFTATLGFAQIINEKFTLLNATTTTGAGSVFNSLYPYNHWLCDIDTTGSPTSITVRIDGNATGDSFDTTGLASETCTASKCSFAIADQPAKNVRAVITTFTGGTNPTVTVTCIGRD